jgi:hypothetical protein
MTYEWRFRDEVIPNATNSLLRIENAGLTNLGAYTPSHGFGRVDRKSGRESIAQPDRFAKVRTRLEHCGNEQWFGDLLAGRRHCAGRGFAERAMDRRLCSRALRMEARSESVALSVEIRSKVPDLERNASRH